MFACGIKKKAILDAQRELGLVEYLDKETPERRPEAPRDKRLDLR